MCNGEWKHIPKLQDYCGKAEGRVNQLVKTDDGSLNIQICVFFWLDIDDSYTVEIFLQI